MRAGGGRMLLGRFYGSLSFTERDFCHVPWRSAVSSFVDLHLLHAHETRPKRKVTGSSRGRSAGQRCLQDKLLVSLRYTSSRTIYRGRTPAPFLVSSTIVGVLAVETELELDKVSEAAVLPLVNLSRPRLRKGVGPRKLPCEHADCAVKRSNYGFPNSDATRCKRHLLTGMVIFDGGCEFSGCNTAAVFNFPGLRPRVRCASHKLDGMVDKIRPVCRNPSCSRVAWYGPDGAKKASLCPAHKSEGMVSIHYSVIARCQSPDGCCLAQATFGDPREGVKRFCRQHKGPAMVNLATSTCLEAGCLKQARYGWPADRHHLLCPTHRREGMVLKWTCAVDGCFKTPCFGFPGEKSPSRCTAHKEEGMRHVGRALCDAEGCERIAYYAHPGGAHQSRCGTHKEVGMVNVVHRRCDGMGCRARARFCAPGERVPVRCHNHKEEGMVYK